MARPPHTNDALAYWITATNASKRGLASELRHTAIQHGRPDVQPDASRITRWVNHGECPRPPVPEFLAATITRLCHLPRGLTPADLGLADGPPTTGPSGDWRPQAVVRAIIDTTRSDAVHEDSPPAATQMLSGTDLTKAVHPLLYLPVEPLPAPTRPGRQIGRSDVLAIQQTTNAFRTLDNTHGGGLSRLAVVGQLQAVTMMATHARSNETVGRELFAAIADLASVAGWMTHDIGRHAEAQTYLLQGLQAAKQAGPTGAGIAGHLLNCLARQANHLGRAEDALELVQTAQYATRKLPPGRLTAILHALEARCHAVLGHLPQTSNAIGATQDALAHADTTTETPSWATWFDTAEYHVTIGVCEHIAAHHAPSRTARAIEMIRTGTAQRPAERTRSRAFDGIALSRAYLSAGQLDAAAETSATALALLGQVTSTRVIDRLRELDHELAAAPPVPVVTETRERIRAALPRSHPSAS